MVVLGIGDTGLHAQWIVAMMVLNSDIDLAPTLPLSTMVPTVILMICTGGDPAVLQAIVQVSYQSSFSFFF